MHIHPGGAMLAQSGRIVLNQVAGVRFFAGIESAVLRNRAQMRHRAILIESRQP